MRLRLIIPPDLRRIYVSFAMKVLVITLTVLWIKHLTRS
jgi:hypothetical protein